MNKCKNNAMKRNRPTHFSKLPDIERRQVRLAENSAAMELALTRLVRVVNRIDALRKERKRLLNPRKSSDSKQSLDWTKDKYIGSGGGHVEGLNDEVGEL